MTSGGKAPPTALPLPLLLPPEGGSYPPPIRCTACGVLPAGRGPAAGDIGSSATWSCLRLTTAEGRRDVRVGGDAASPPPPLAAATEAASSLAIRAEPSSG